jgi:Zn-dependent protease with chaperone function
MGLPRRRWLLLFIAVLHIAAAISTVRADAATTRPNAVDVRVDNLPASVLLAKPATALVDPERQVAARRLEQLMFPGWLASILAQIVALAYFWQSGLAARLRDWLRRRGGAEWWVRFQFGGALALIAFVAALIPDFYIYRISRTMGLSDQLLRGWSLDWIVNVLATMVVTACIVTIVLWLVDRTHQWYLYTIVVIFFMSYALVFAKPLLFSPLRDRFEPLPPAAAAIARSVETQAKLNVPLVMEVRSRTHLGTAYVEGMGPTKRVVLGDAVFAVSSADELRYLIAHQLGDIESGAPFRVAFLDALCVIFGAAVAVAIADRIGFRRDDDPTSRLALVAALLGVVYLIVLPINNAALRRIAAQSDRYAIGLTGERAAAIRTIVRGADQSLRDACPSVSSRLFLNTVDDPSRRVAAINNVPSGCPR